MFNCILVIIGTIIGAGFASGKEIFTFFNIYGFFGFIGLLISGIIIGFIIYRTYCIIIKYNIISYSHFVNVVMTKSNFVNSVICNIVNIFLLISFVIMVAGFSAYFSQEYNIANIFGATIIALLSFFTFLKNIDGIVKVNKYFIPFLIFIILLLGLKNLHCFTSFEIPTRSSSFNWIISSLLYASYNLIIITPILISLKKYINTFKSAKLISVFSTIFIMLIALVLYFLLNYYFIDIKALELPTIYIASQSGNLFKYICGFVILGAIFTTAISSGYSFLCNLNIKNRKLYIFLAFSICLLSVLLSNIGFSTLLNLLYPILGLLRFYTNSFCVIIRSLIVNCTK